MEHLLRSGRSLAFVPLSCTHEVAKMVLCFRLEPLVELIAFDGAVADTSLLSWKQFVLFHRQEAVLGALVHYLLVHIGQILLMH